MSTQIPSHASLRIRIPFSGHCQTRGIHHGNGLPSRKKPPLGPLSGRVAARRIAVAPSLTERGAPAPPISAATQHGQDGVHEDTRATKFAGESALRA